MILKIVKFIKPMTSDTLRERITGAIKAHDRFTQGKTGPNTLATVEMILAAVAEVTPEKFQGKCPVHFSCYPHACVYQKGFNQAIAEMRAALGGEK